MTKIVVSRWSLVFSETPTLVLPLRGGGEEREGARCEGRGEIVVSRWSLVFSEIPRLV